MWHCAAYKKSLAIFPDGIAPCCKIKFYRKPFSDIGNLNAFNDLIIGSPPAQCHECVEDENHNLISYRSFFNSNQDNTDSLQFVDIRNSNLCNLKCRTCGPHASSQWDKERNNIIYITKSESIEKYYDVITSSTVKDFYFTGGEPFLIPEHWKLLTKLIELGNSKNIKLRYNTNLTVLKYKELDIFQIWQQFKNVSILCSIDAIGERFNYIRSGAKWEQVEQNLLEVKKNKQVQVSIAYTLSILNIWDVNQDLIYFKKLNMPVNISILNNPDILSIQTIPDKLKNVALDCVNKSKHLLSKNLFDSICQLIQNNNSKHLFKSTLGYILYLDKIRNENLFDQLPFKDLAYEMFVSNA